MGGRRVEKQCFELPKKSYLHLQVIFLQFVSQIFEFCEIRLFLKVIFKHFKNWLVMKNYEVVYTQPRT